jgi:hypothetical protein
MLKPHDLVVEISQLHHEGRQCRARCNGRTISTSQLVRFDVSPRNPFADFLVELRGFKPLISAVQAEAHRRAAPRPVL